MTIRIEDKISLPFEGECRGPRGGKQVYEMGLQGTPNQGYVGSYIAIRLNSLSPHGEICHGNLPCARQPIMNLKVLLGYELSYVKRAERLKELGSVSESLPGSMAVHDGSILYLLSCGEETAEELDSALSQVTPEAVGDFLDACGREDLRDEGDMEILASSMAEEKKAHQDLLRGN
jgi:hypothetical protein